MKKYLRFYLKAILIVLHFVILFILVWGLSLSTVKNIMTSVIINEFRNKGVLQEDISTSKVEYYKIESDNPLEEASFTHYNSKFDGWPEDIPGGKCDILASTEATLLGPITSSFITYTVGGHAALSTSSYIDDKFMLSDDEIIEATGMNDGDNPTVVSNKLYWINDRVYKSMMVLRTNITEEQKDEVLSYCSSFIGDPYNFSFLFNTKNQVYCSDIISRSFLKVGINLNKDGFQTTVYDLIVSSDSYLSYYHIFENGVKKIYYLGSYKGTFE